MSSMSPPNLWVTPASPVVVEQMSRLNDKADTMFNRARQAVDELMSLDFSNVDIDPRMHFSQEDIDALLAQLGPLPDDDWTDWLRGLNLSAGDENFVFNQTLLNRLQERFPEQIAPVAPAVPAVPEAPADPGDPVEVPPPERPVLGNYTAPDVDTDIPMPQYTDMTAEVPFPELRPITLPPVPNLALDEITFDLDKPQFDGQVPDIADFSFDPATYTPTYLSQVEQAIGRMFDGQTGLPPEVEEALFERAREREIELGEREVAQVSDEWAARGHRFPSGPHARRVDRARREASYKVSQLNREQFIAHWQFQLEQLRVALTTAVAAEEVLSRLFIEGEQLRFQAARFHLEMAMQVFNAFVTKYNAEVAMYQAEITVYRERLQAETVKLEAYNAQLRGQQLIGELNAQDVQIFAERLRALQINSEIYRTRIAAYTAQFEAARTKIEVYRAQLEANKNLVDIYQADTQAFVEMIRAQQVREERFSTKAAIYGRQMEAWKTLYEGRLAGQQAELEVLRFQRDAYTADSERLNAWINGERGRVQALADKYQAIAQEVGARSEAERTRLASVLGIANAAIERYKAATDILLKNAEINIQSGLTAANLLLRSRETAATTWAQLAAGLTSAANINASISDGSSSSLSYSFSGDIDVN